MYSELHFFLPSFVAVLIHPLSSVARSSCVAILLMPSASHHKQFIQLNTQTMLLSPLLQTSSKPPPPFALSNFLFSSHWWREWIWYLRVRCPGACASYRRHQRHIYILYIPSARPQYSRYLHYIASHSPAELNSKCFCAFVLCAAHNHGRVVVFYS